MCQEDVANAERDEAEEQAAREAWAARRAKPPHRGHVSQGEAAADIRMGDPSPGRPAR